METVVQRLNRFNKMAPSMIRQNTPLIDWLTDAGFFSAPADKKAYGYEGGLFDYSVRAVEILSQFTSGMDLGWDRPESPFIIGMFHALHKMDELKEVVDKPGKTMFGEDFERGRESHYERNRKTLLSGAGDKSIMLLAQFMTLTPEEVFCIRYYNGGGKNYRRAAKMFVRLPLVRAAAEMASLKERCVKNETD